MRRGDFMSVVLFRVLVAFLAVVGIIELLRAVLFSLLKTDNPGRFYLVLSFSGHDEQAEAALRSASERARWFCDDVQVVCLDAGMDEETRRICELVCSETPGILLMTPAEFQEYWSGRFANL